MDFAYIVRLLALITLLAALIFALVSKKKVDERRADPTRLKSTLAENESNTERHESGVSDRS